MKKLLVPFLFILTANGLLACMSASQNRLFPLGISSKGLLVVETHLHRTEKEEKGGKIVPAWSGNSYFKIYDKNYHEVYSQLLDSIKLFEQNHYNSIVGKSFAKGLRLAEKFPDFIAAEPVSLSFCDYQESCSKAGLLFDTINNKISIRLSDNSKYEVTVIFDPKSVASNLLNYFQNYNTVLSADFLKGRLYINSVRLFKVRDKKLTIVHIGRGQIFEQSEGGTYPPGKEYESEFSFNDINKSIFEEPVLHHGQGFDFYIWEL